MDLLHPPRTAFPSSSLLLPQDLYTSSSLLPGTLPLLHMRGFLMGLFYLSNISEGNRLCKTTMFYTPRDSLSHFLIIYFLVDIHVQNCLQYFRVIVYYLSPLEESKPRESKDFVFNLIASSYNSA